MFTPKKLLLWAQRYQSRAFNHYLSALLINMVCHRRFKLQISVKRCDIVYSYRGCLLWSRSLIEVALFCRWCSSIGYFRLLVAMRLVNIVLKGWSSLLPNCHVIKHLCSNSCSDRMRLIKRDVLIILAQLWTSSQSYWSIQSSQRVDCETPLVFIHLHVWGELLTFWHRKLSEELLALTDYTCLNRQKITDLITFVIIWNRGLRET